MATCPEVLQQKLMLDLSSILPSDEVAHYRANVLKQTLLKKYVPPGNDALLHREAINEFIDRNEKLSDKFDVPNHRRDLFNFWQSRLYDVLMTEDYQGSVLTIGTCFLNGKPGPGSSRGTRFTDFFRKMFDSDLTYTDTFLASHYESSLPERWKRANLIRRLYHSNKQVEGSSLTSVPKDSRKNRCICTEPAINMFYQLGAHSVLALVLKRHFKLDLKFQQELNKNAARLGSIDGSNATIDLSNASDHIHYDLVKQLLPYQVFSTLDKIRSKNYTVDGEVYKFNMISSMGNGFTFALMTLLLVSLLDVFLSTKGSRYTPYRDGVFGDDIILPVEHYNEFSLVLSDFGFKVNHDKSFATGFFRESCGGDFFQGFNVRGIYIRKLNNEADIYSAFNRLLMWSARNGIDLNHTLLYLKGLVEFRPVPFDEGDDSGFKIPREFVTGRKIDQNGAVYYRPLRPIPSRFRVNDDVRNYHGAFICALGGFIRGQAVSFRSQGTTRYQVAKKKTPNWDHLINPGLTIQDVRQVWAQLVCVSA